MTFKKLQDKYKATSHYPSGSCLLPRHYPSFTLSLVIVYTCTSCARYTKQLGIIQAIYTPNRILIPLPAPFLFTLQMLISPQTVTADFPIKLSLPLQKRLNHFFHCTMFFTIPLLLSVPDSIQIFVVILYSSSTGHFGNHELCPISESQIGIRMYRVRQDNKEIQFIMCSKDSTLPKFFSQQGACTYRHTHYVTY